MRRTPQAASVPRPGALEALSSSSSSAGSSAGSEGQRERLGMISEDFFRWQRSAPILSRIGAQTACVARARSGHRERGACRDLPERELVEVPTREVPSRYRTDFGDPEFGTGAAPPAGGEGNAGEKPAAPLDAPRQRPFGSFCLSQLETQCSSPGYGGAGRGFHHGAWKPTFTNEVNNQQEGYWYRPQSRVVVTTPSDIRGARLSCGRSRAADGRPCALLEPLTEIKRGP
ncbi:unnamed protein product [Lampetra fluviatilis]